MKLGRKKPTAITVKQVAEAVAEEVQLLALIVDAQNRQLMGLMAGVRHLPTLLSVESAATQLDTTPSTVRRLISNGTIRVARIGGRYKVPLSEVYRLATPMFRAEERPPFQMTREQKNRRAIDAAKFDRELRELTRGR